MRPVSRSHPIRRSVSLLFTALLLVFFPAGCTPSGSGETAGTAPVSAAQQSGSNPSEQASPGPSASGEASAANIGRRAEFDAFLEGVNAERKAASEAVQAPDLSPYTPAPVQTEETLTPEEAAALLEQRETRTVSGPEAAEDAELFFRMLRTDYGPYEYFGGDRVFFPLRDAVQDELSGLEEVSPETLEKTLADCLAPVLLDGHFRIGGTHPVDANSQTMYFVPDLFLDSTDGLDPVFLRPTIGPDGRITTCFAALSHDGGGLPAEAEVNGSRVPLNWKRVESEAYLGGPAFVENETEGIPLLTVRRMYAENNDPEQEEQLSRFAASGTGYHRAPLLFLDLRGNTGGDGIYSTQWLSGYTGIYTQTLDCHSMGLKLGPLSASRSSDASGSPESGWKVSSTRGYWCGPEKMGSDALGYLFVLQDRACASAAETLCSSLRYRANTLFVGSNTAGCYLNNVQDFQLPNSGLPIRAGNSLLLDGVLGNVDGKGFLPDLWVAPDDALDAVSRLCAYYGLNA